MPKVEGEEPTHGFCTVCKGAIPKGVQWTLTRLMFRVHADPDDCIFVLRPRMHRASIPKLMKMSELNG